MPNHVTHRIMITGAAEKIAAFKAAFIACDKEGEEKSFDFGKIIPMPEVLRGTTSDSHVNIGLWLLGAYGAEHFAHWLKFSWVVAAGVTDLDGLKRLLEEIYPDARAEAEPSMQALAETGHKDWYTWSIANWGTKWNYYHFDWAEAAADCVEMKFDTAWSSPEPIFQALADRPELDGLLVEIDAFDEGWGFAFKGVIREGEFDGEFVAATPEMYETVYGEPYESEDDE